MKKLDRLILFETFPVFIISFVVSAFVLMMQFMFLYIDEIAGKGVGIFVIVEFIFYLSLTFIPLALPISILIASVMVYGNLGERYELASIKSAGISYQRMLYPIIFFSFLAAGFSFVASEYIIPVANVKSRSRLYDMSKKKPTLNIKEGVFNTDFEGYGIRIGKKNKDGTHIEDVILYDYSSNYNGTSNIIIAKRGQMIVTPGENAFVMILEDGKQYQEVQRYRQSQSSSEPFMVTQFERYQKVFDLSAFQLQSTNESYFKNHQSSMNTKELRAAIDSTRSRLNALHDRVELEMAYDLPFIRSKILEQRQLERDSLQNVEDPEATTETEAVADSIIEKGKDDSDSVSVTHSLTVTDSMEMDTLPDLTVRESEAHLVRKPAAERENPEPIKLSQPAAQTVWEQLTPGFLDSIPHDSLLLEGVPAKDRMEVISSVRSGFQSMKDQVSYRSKQMDADYSKIIKSTYELHFKYALAMSCIIFVLIGGSMGSIVRKGGFGYSLLISIVFFVTFIMMTILFRKTSEGYRLSPVLAAYLPNIILLPIGIFLVYKAVNDSKLSLDFTRIISWISRWSENRKDAETRGQQ